MRGDAMTTTAIGIGQVPKQEAAPDTPAASTEFAQMLGEVQSGAPPGPEPPQKVPEQGAVTLPPNAGAQTLDLLPELAKNEEDLALEAGELSIDLLELLAAQVIPVPLAAAVTIGQTPADPIGSKQTD